MNYVRSNVTFSIGNVAIIDKFNGQTGFLDFIFGELKGKAKTFIPCIKLLMYNRLGECLPVYKLAEFIPKELFELLGFEKKFPTGL